MLPRAVRRDRRRLKRRVRGALALQTAAVALSIVAAGLTASGEAPLRAVATRVHWRIHERPRLPQSLPQRNKRLARDLLPKYGWQARGQFACLEHLWARESGWNHRAANPSGAYGIPQALPGSKMRSAGADWRTNPRTQIRWGLRYIKGRYGSPCAAWGHSLATGWY